MLIEAKNILDLPIATIDEKAKIGLVKQIVVDKKNAKVLGFIVHINSFLFGKNLFLSESDVLDIDSNGLTTQNKENLIDPQEVMRVKKIIDERFNIFGLDAITKSKKRLGKISNFVIETQTLQIVKFYINTMFENKIINFDKVYKITKKEIIFEEDTERQMIKKQTEKLAVN